MSYVPLRTQRDALAARRDGGSRRHPCPAHCGDSEHHRGQARLHSSKCARTPIRLTPCATGGAVSGCACGRVPALRRGGAVATASRGSSSGSVVKAGNVRVTVTSCSGRETTSIGSPARMLPSLMTRRYAPDRRPSMKRLSRLGRRKVRGLRRGGRRGGRTFGAGAEHPLKRGRRFAVPPPPRLPTSVY